MKMFVRVASVVGGVLFGLLLLFAASTGFSGASAGGDSNPLALLGMLCPIVYFAICFWTSFATRRDRRVLTAGIVAHGCLGAFVLMGILAGDIPFIFLAAGLVCTLVWTSMYFTLSHDNAA